MVKSYMDQVHTWLIRWKGGTVGDNTWDDILVIKSRNFEASLEDKTFLMAGVMIGIENIGPDTICAFILYMFCIKAPIKGKIGK